MIFCVVVFGINFTVLRQFKLVSKEKFTKPVHCWLLRNAKGNKYGKEWWNNACNVSIILICLNYVPCAHFSQSKPDSWDYPFFSFPKTFLVTCTPKISSFSKSGFSFISV